MVAASALQLDVESLRTLIAVVDHGGMTRAAEHLHLSQSAVSWKIKRLEEKVGRPLLVREGHSIRPNRDGQALIDDGRQMVELHDRAVLRLQRAELTGRVRLGANGDVGVQRLVNVLGGFRRIHPGAHVQFTVTSTEDLTDMVEEGRVDLALLQMTAANIGPDDTVLWSEQLRWARAAWEKHDESPVALVTYGDRCFYQGIAQPILERGGYDHYVAFAGSATPAIQGAVEAGLGIGLLTDRYVTDDMAIWEPGDDLEPLPEAHQVVRTVPGENPDIVAALTDVIVHELR